jgi:hypothetical protein
VQARKLRTAQPHSLRVQRPTPGLLEMCGRFTQYYTWAEIERLYRLPTEAACRTKIRPPKAFA